MFFTLTTFMFILIFNTAILAYDFKSKISWDTLQSLQNVSDSWPLEFLGLLTVLKFYVQNIGKRWLRRVKCDCVAALRIRCAGNVL